MINKSFQLLRTNPILTTNYKIVVTSDYKIYLESFDSIKDLSNLKYKHYILNKNNFLEDKLPEFYDGLPYNIAFYVKYDNDVNIAYKDYQYQFDDIYFSGAKNIEDQFYKEEFEYFAPLYIRKNELPSNFIIMRVDDPIIYENTNTGFDIGSLSPDNFRSEVVDKWKCIQVFDLSMNSDFGYFLINNINNNERFQNKSLFIDFKKDNLSKWYGMDYDTGVYTEKSVDLSEILKYDNPHFALEKYITEGYKNNKIIFPNILNLKFLFDDTPATPFELKKYSINRYYGFYVEQMDYVVSLTSYVTKPLKSNIQLLNNIIISGGTNSVVWNNDESDYDIEPLSINPFLEEWDDSVDYYIYIKDNLHKIIKTYENDKYYYKVISEEVLDQYFDTGLTNQYTVTIDFDGDYNFINPISNNFSIDQYLDCSNTNRVMYSDLYLIKIDDKYHVLKNGSGITYSDPDTYNTNKLMNQYYIQTDYAINSNTEYLEYWILGNNSEYYKKINTENYKEIPLTFPIYTVKFSDIKDFDFNRVNTKFADFDYEKTEYVKTNEEKLYATEHRDLSLNKEFKLDKVNTISQYNIANISSEYSANDELFQIKNNDLTDLWRKNPYICKWGYNGSIGHADYPYKLNSTIIGGSVTNRSVDCYITNSDITNKTLDYFYRIGNFYSGNTTNPIYYRNQTTNIQTEFINNNMYNFGDGFNLKKYFESDIDYFEFYFNNKMYYQDNNLLYTKDFTKYSVFNGGDSYNFAETVFKGIKYKIMPVQNITLNNNKITNIIFGKSNNYNNYKISVILNDIYYYEDDTYLMNGINDELGMLPISKNGIHIIMNNKFKNILIILNVIIYMKKEYKSFNNIDIFDEKEGIYTKTTKTGSNIYTSNPINQYNPNSITANDFITSLNDYNNKYFASHITGNTDPYTDYVKYYYIDEYNNTIYSGNSFINDFTNSTIDHVRNWKRKYPPFLLYAYQPDVIDVITNNFIYKPIFGPDKNKLRTSISPDLMSEPLARSIEVNKQLGMLNYATIHRYSGIYEPIFKNLEIFELSNFCINDLEEYTGVTTGLSLQNNAFYATENTQGKSFTNGKHWSNLSFLCNSNDLNGRSPIYPTISIGSLETISTNYVSFPIIVNFNFNIPLNSIIKGIELYITRKSSYKITSSPKKYVIDGDSNNGNYGQLRFLCDNTWSSLSVDSYGKWETLFTTYKYGNSTETWGFASNILTPNNVNNDFNLYYGCMIYKEGATPANLIAQLSCISCKIYYDIGWTGYTYTSFNYFGNNYRFDEGRTNFGKYNEFVYSKVNNATDILRYDNKNIKNIYPMIDQYGYSYSDRFIFKSNWDKDYYYLTNNIFE